MPTLNVNLTQPLSEFIEHQVGAGEYQSASEMVRDALRLLRREKELDAMKLELIRREVGRGLDEANGGRFSNRSLDELASEVLREDTSSG